MATLDDVRAAIEKNLSAEVGEILKKRLAKADIDAATCETQKEKIASLEKQISDLYSRVKIGDELEARIQKAEAAERSLLAATALKEIVDLKLEFAKERVNDMKHLVALVFQNNQYKYQVTDNGYLPVPQGPGGGGYFTANHSRTIAGEGTGAPPPAPGDVSR